MCAFVKVTRRGRTPVEGSRVIQARIAANLALATADVTLGKEQGGNRKIRGRKTQVPRTKGRKTQARRTRGREIQGREEGVATSTEVEGVPRPVAGRLKGREEPVLSTGKPKSKGDYLMKKTVLTTLYLFCLTVISYGQLRQIPHSISEGEGKPQPSHFQVDRPRWWRGLPPAKQDVEHDSGSPRL